MHYGCPLLRVCVQGVCVFTTVCALGWVKCKAQILSMGHHTWPGHMSLHFILFIKTNYRKASEDIEYSAQFFFQ